MIAPPFPRGGGLGFPPPPFPPPTPAIT